MKCKDIMKPDVVTCRPDETAQDCAKKMRDQNVGFMPVIDGQGKVKGTVTDRDLVIRCLADHKGGDCKIESIMSSDIVGCRPEDELSKAEQAMEKAQKSRILVCDDAGKCVGVISLSDIAQKEDTKRSGEILRNVTRREAVGV